MCVSVTRCGNETVSYRAVSYTALSVNESLANKRILVVAQPSRSSEFNPHHYYFFRLSFFEN